MKHCGLLVALVLLFAACTRQPLPDYNSRLEAMAASMDSVHWNTPCPAIEAIDPALLNTRADSALYSLLAYANIKRSGLSAPADSLIATAADFYADGREPRRAMMAWYFRACSNWDAGQYADAVYYALHMKPYAEQLADTLYLIRFCDIMASSFEQTHNYLESARYYNEALALSRSNPARKNWQYGYFAQRALQGWSNAGLSDSALVVFRENTPILLKQEVDTAEMVNLLLAYHLAVRTNPSPDYQQIARDFYAIDANPLAHHVLDSIDYLRLERDYYWAKERNLRSIDSLLIELDAVGIDTFNLQHPVSMSKFPNVVQAQQAYIIEAQECQAKHLLQRRTRLILQWGTLGLLILVCGGVWFHHWRIKRKEAERMALIDELRELHKEMTLREEADKSLAHKLFAQRLHEINLLCDNYYNHHDIGEKAKSVFYREFESRISELGSKETIAEIERLVNECKDGLIASLRAELPDLKEQNVNFLTYIYAGFSARSVCIFMGISKDNFYMRRRRIKSAINASAAPSRERFIAEMG